MKILVFCPFPSSRFVLENVRFWDNILTHTSVRFGQFQTIRHTRELLDAHEEIGTMLAAQYFAYHPIDGGEFGPGASEGAYFCSDAATREECKAIVLQTARWTSCSS